MSPNGDNCRIKAALVLGLLALAAAALPAQHSASARVLLPAGAAAQALGELAAARGMTLDTHGASRIADVRRAGAEPAAAARELGEFVRSLAPEGVILVDEPSVGARWPALRPGLLGAGFFLTFVSILLFVKAKTRRIPDRKVVREAVLLAQRGHRTLLVERGARFRVVIVDKRADLGDLQVLARPSHGALVFGQR